MNPILSRFKMLGTAAVVAATLGLGALAAAPAVAQDAPPSGFSLSVPGGGDGPTMAPNSGSQRQMGAPQESQMAAPNEGQGEFRRGRDRFRYCLDDRDIREALQDYGFTRARVTNYLRGDRVEATAFWGRNQYSMRIDRCSGVVDRVRLIRRSGFGLQFNFSN